MNKRHLRWLLVVLVLLAIGAYFLFDLGHYFSLEYVKSRQQAFQSYYAAHRLLTLLTYMGVYVLVTALSVPGAVVLTLAGGLMFGLLVATVVVSFASTIGATLAFLAARFVLRDAVQRRFAQRLRRVNEGVEREGAFYLFTLRLIAAVPFFLINLLMGLTRIPTWRFFWVSQLGMLPGTLVYVNAGTQLGRIEALGDIFSPGLIVSLALLGVFPLAAKRVAEFLRARRRRRRFPAPSTCDYNLVVIGAGSGGLVAAYIAAALKAKVALVERERMGGDCLNTGCVPSKALIRTARFVADARRATALGLERVELEMNFAQVMERVQRAIRKVEPHDSVERYTALGVECLAGEATLRSPYEVEVAGRVLTTRNIVIATGARPLVPPIEGLDEVGYLTSDTVWELRRLPRRLLVIGGGPIGCELAQAFQVLGAQVTLMERAQRLLTVEDEDVSEVLQRRFETDGIRILVGHEAVRFGRDQGVKYVSCDASGTEVRVEFDEVLVALGRRPSVEGFGLERLGVVLNDRGGVETDSWARTNFPNIFACGDVTGSYQFTHTAAHQAWYATVNALLRPWKRFKVDYRSIPWCTFTTPEVAHVGMNEQQAHSQGVAFEVTRYPLSELDRAIVDEDDDGFVKVLTAPGRDRILGATIVGAHAGEMIAEFVTAMRHRLGLNKILGTIHVYPTFSEANKYAAGAWKRAHAPQRVLGWLGRFQSRRRGG
ncbi:MAG: FAD-dependent oxidoreductase [Gammaproteobacteria bacterium]